MSGDRCDQHCVASQPFGRSAKLPKRRENGPEIPTFRAAGFVSWGANCRKSPATSANIPVLQRLSAESGFDHDCRPRCAVIFALVDKMTPNHRPVLLVQGVTDGAHRPFIAFARSLTDLLGVGLRLLVLAKQLPTRSLARLPTTPAVCGELDPTRRTSR